MASKDPSPSSLSGRVAEWRSAYEAALKETNTATLFKCVEVAEAAILTRRAHLEGSRDHHAERQDLEAALAYLRVLKTERLKFTASSK